MRISDWSSDVCSSDLEDSLMLRSFLKPKNQQDDEGWFSCRRSSYRARCAPAPARWMSCLPRFRSSACARRRYSRTHFRSEEHTSELQSIKRISYAVFCLKQTTKPHSNNAT